MENFKSINVSRSGWFYKCKIQEANEVAEVTKAKPKKKALAFIKYSLKDN